MSRNIFWTIIIIIFLTLSFLLFRSFQAIPNNKKEAPDNKIEDKSFLNESINNNSEILFKTKSGRDVFVTDGIKHSIALNEIISGGVVKDGIPSIDDPGFVDTKEADDWLDEDSIGLGVEQNGVAKFYPYQILVWHEIVNDTIAENPIVVTYCPLCATGIVYNRTIKGEVLEFGVSGKLWRSNLLMYNRTGNENTESLWSQVLGEAVLGERVGEKLSLVRSDTVSYEDWKKLYPETKILSKDTGINRVYDYDPYKERGYYESTEVSYGAEFEDSRAHPKTLIVGIEIDNKYKAYSVDSLKVGNTTDIFNGVTITINKSAEDIIKIYKEPSKAMIPYIRSFWFSWLAVHPETELLN